MERRHHARRPAARGRQTVQPEIVPADGSQGDIFRVTVVAVPCLGDIDGDGTVGITDFLLLLAAWGPCAGCPEDLDQDGMVGIIGLLAAWGPCA